jgi:hypothetical protein
MVIFGSEVVTVERAGEESTQTEVEKDRRLRASFELVT